MHLIKRYGGLKSTLTKAIQLYRREGLAGIWRGLRILATWAGVVPALGSGKYDRNDYAEWTRRYDTLTDASRAAMRASVAVAPHTPCVSILMPISNAKQEWLIDAIESVRNQIYPHWELCIAADVLNHKVICSILDRYAKEDSRIKVQFVEENTPISTAFNRALELATGEWVVLLDHDDLLSEHALFWVTDAIYQNPDICLIYSDEDQIDQAGKRLAPYFKCDWNIDLFYTHNLIAHLGVYRSSTLREVGGFRIGREGAEAYDLALRYVERIDDKNIDHIARVLYHRRRHTEDSERSSEIEPYAVPAAEGALNEYFQRQGMHAKAEFSGYGYRVRYALPSTLPLVSLIIPTRNGLHLLRQCVDSILEKTTYSNYELLIVDNGSDEPKTIQYLSELHSDSRIRVIYDDRPFNYSALNNAAVKLASGEIIALINNDIEVISPDWLSEMVSHAMRPGIGAVGARLWYPNNTLQHGGVIIGIGGVAGHSHKHLIREAPGFNGRAQLTQTMSAVTAACLVVKKSIFQEVGGLDETNLTVAFNDVDFCLRVCEAGYRNVWTPYAELYHHESATRGYEDTPGKKMRFGEEAQYMQKRWGDMLLNDPAYSPNLTLAREDFSYAWPPRIKVI